MSDRSKVWLNLLAVALAAAFFIFVVVRVIVQDDADDAAPVPAPTSTSSSTGSPDANIHASHEDACAAFAESSPRMTYSEAQALADKEAIAPQLLASGDAVSVGLTTCPETGGAHGWVIIVRVQNEGAAVPPAGPAGTPVLTYVGDSYTAF